MPRTYGATTSTSGMSRWTAQASSSERVAWAPAPSRTPETFTVPGQITMMLAPRLWICSATRAWAPAPTATMVMTAPTPITMPSMVSALRILLTRRALTAIRALARTFTSGPPRLSTSSSSEASPLGRVASSSRATSRSATGSSRVRWPSRKLRTRPA